MGRRRSGEPQQRASGAKLQIERDGKPHGYTGAANTGFADASTPNCG
jgi:hypothetical protein